MGLDVIKDNNEFLRFCCSHRGCRAQAKGMRYIALYEIGSDELLPPTHFLHSLNTYWVMSVWTTVPSVLWGNRGSVFPTWQSKINKISPTHTVLFLAKVLVHSQKLQNFDNTHNPDMTWFHSVRVLLYSGGPGAKYKPQECYWRDTVPVFWLSCTFSHVLSSTKRLLCI